MYVLFSFCHALRRFFWAGTLLLSVCVNSGAQTFDVKKYLEEAGALGKKLNAIADKKNPDSVIQLLNELLPQFIAQKNDLAVTNTFLKIGETYLNEGDCMRALTSMRQALPYCATLPFIEKSNYYQHLGWVYSELGDYLAASENYYLALDYYKRLFSEVFNL